MGVSAAVALAGALFAAFAIRAKQKSSFSLEEAEEVLAMSPDPPGQVEAASQL